MKPCKDCNHMKDLVNGQCNACRALTSVGVFGPVSLYQGKDRRWVVTYSGEIDLVTPYRVVAVKKAASLAHLTLIGSRVTSFVTTR